MKFMNKFDKLLVEKYGFVELYDEEYKLFWMMPKLKYSLLALEQMRIAAQTIGENLNDDEEKTIINEE